MTEIGKSGSPGDSLFESSSGVMLLADLNTGFLVDANPAAAAFYRMPREEMQGTALCRMFAVTDQDLKSLMTPVSSGSASRRLKGWLPDGSLQELEVFICHVSVKGAECALLIANPVTESGLCPGEHQEELMKQAAIQELLVRISSTYIDLPLEELKGEIEKSLGEMGTVIGADRGYLFRYDFSDGTCTNTDEWCAEGIEPQIENLQGVPLDAITRWVDANRRGENFYIADVSSLDCNEARWFLEPQGKKSLIAVPLMRGTECLGFVGFDSVRMKHAYTPTELNLLLVFAQVLVSVHNRREAENQLALREAVFRKVVLNSPMAIFLLRVNHEGRLILEDANPAADRILGVENGPLKGLALEDAYPPLANTELPERYLRAAEHGETWRTPGVSFSYAGKAGIYAVHAFQIEPGRCAVLLEDVVERIAAEEMLAETNRMLADVIETIPARVFWKDLQGRFMGCNSLFAADAGLPDAECLRGKTDYDMVWAPEAEKYRADDRDVVETGIPKLAFEEEQTTPDGTRRILRTSKIPLRSADGRVYGMLGAYEDITESRKAEEESEKLRQQLIQVQKMESIGRLAGGLAHDYNNMLGVILGHVELAMHKIGKEDPLLSDLQEIQHAARRSADLTRQVLAFARRQSAQPAVLPLNETLSKMLVMMQRLIGEDISLEWYPEECSGRVVIDSSQLDQIIANLLVNARDAIGSSGTITMRTGSVTFTEETCRGISNSFPGDFSVFSVSDDGCGMDHPTQKMLFEPFFTTKEPGKGIGLGLSTVYGIVSQNGGFITVDSTPGRGSCFSIHLPIYRGAGIRQPAIKTAVNEYDGTEHIFLVEDEPAILNITRLMLQRAGYRVTGFSSPVEALAAATENPDCFDLLVTDMIMPGMNGQELVDRMSSVKQKVKYLFMSGYTADVITRKGVLHDGVHFVQKPFSYSGLTEAVRRALGDI